MRIIAGSLGGRTFDSPNSHKTHPMSERVRGGLFNVLGDINGLTVLDAFAGSGALGFEALSRGAKAATLIDNDKAAQSTIRANIEKLGLIQTAKLISAGLSSWLGTSADTFDIILCDPPYDNLQLSVIKQLTKRLNVSGTLVLSLPKGQYIPEITNLNAVTNKNYGDTQLVFYKKA